MLLNVKTTSNKLFFNKVLLLILTVKNMWKEKRKRKVFIWSEYSSLISGENLCHVLLSWLNFGFTPPHAHLVFWFKQKKKKKKHTFAPEQEVMCHSRVAFTSPWCEFCLTSTPAVDASEVHTSVWIKSCHLWVSFSVYSMPHSQLV